MFYKHSWVIFISENPFWWSTLQNSCLWNASVMKCQSLMSALMLSTCKEIRKAFFFFLIWRPWGVLDLLWWVRQMKPKDLFKIKVWRSKTSRGDGGQRPLNHRPQKVVEGRGSPALQVQYRCGAAGLSEDQPQPVHSQLTDRGLDF